MVADEVDNRQVCLVVSGTEAAAELLHKDNWRLGWTQHQDGIDVGDVDALVEDVDSAEYLDLSVPELTKRLRARGRRIAAVHSDGLHTVLPKELGCEVGVSSAAAKSESLSWRAGSVALIFPKGLFRSATCRNRAC